MIGSDFGNVLYRAQSGDESAFACLWWDINPTLKRYLRVIAGEVNQDVIAQTWVIVGRGLARFQGDEMTWRSWVFATARRAEPAAFARRSLPALQLTDDDAAPVLPTSPPGPLPPKGSSMIPYRASSSELQAVGSDRLTRAARVGWQGSCGPWFDPV